MSNASLTVRVSRRTGHVTHRRGGRGFAEALAERLCAAFLPDCCAAFGLEPEPTSEELALTDAKARRVAVLRAELALLEG